MKIFELSLILYIALFGSFSNQEYASTRVIESFEIEIIKSFWPADLKYFFDNDSIKIFGTYPDIYPEKDDILIFEKGFSDGEKKQILKAINKLDITQISGSYVNECVEGGLVLDIQIKIPNQEVQSIHLANYYHEESAKITELINNYHPNVYISYEEDKEYMIYSQEKCSKRNQRK